MSKPGDGGVVNPYLVMHSWNDILNMPDREYKYVRFDAHTKVFEIKREGQCCYMIPLCACKTSGQCLDWLHQVYNKAWMTPDMWDEFMALFYKHIDGTLWKGRIERDSV